MKSKLTKVVSVILLIAFLVSCTSVFAAASDSATTERNDGITTIFNRGFDDGWEIKNGGSLVGGDVHTITTGVEEGIFESNRYVKMISSGDGKACYYQLSPKAADVSSATEFVIEFSIREDSEVSTGKDISLLPLRFKNGSDTHSIWRMKDDTLKFKWGGENVDVGKLTDEWTRIALSFSIDTATRGARCVCYVDGEEKAAGVYTIPDGVETYPQFARFQLHSSSGANVGSTISFDDIKYYVGTSELTELDDEDYGTLVDTSLEKTEGGSTSSEEKTNADYIAESLIMKVGTNRALKANERVNLFEGPLAGQYGEPVVIDDTVYLPLVPMLEYMGLSYFCAENTLIDITSLSVNPETGAVTASSISLGIGRDTAVVGGEIVKLTGEPKIVRTGLYHEGEEVSYFVVAMDDVEKLFDGWYITYDAMGFIMLAAADELMHRDTDLDSMVALMQKFVFDDPTADELLEDLSAATNNFDHPYLYGNDDDFDFLRSVYYDEYLLEDGTPNTEFLKEHGLTLEELQMLDKMITGAVLDGVSNYVNYIIPSDYAVNGNKDYFFNSVGNLYSDSYYTESVMYDADGNFIFPYDDTVRGEGKAVFAPMFTTKGAAAKKIWDLVVDEYVVVEALYNSTPKKDYIYDPATDSYVNVGEGNGVFDYIAYDFVDLKKPEKNYKYDSITQSYVRVDVGTGTHDRVGKGPSGEYVYVQLRAPQDNYARLDRFDTTSYNFAFPSIYYFNFETDPSNVSTYLEVNADNPTLCQLCGVDHFGYDCEGARLSSAGHIEKARALAFAYMITGELNYARLAYDVLDVMGNWSHWGPAHALNVAEASGSYGLTLDWIYDAVVEMSADGETNYKGEPMSVKVLEQHLWEHGIGEDYVMAIMKKKTAYCRDNTAKPGIVADYYYTYYTYTSNWGNVCGANLALAAMALLSYTDTLNADTNFSKVYTKNGVSLPFGTSYQELTLDVLEYKFFTLHYYGATGYIPEGAYGEGPSYWGYGTNEMLYMITALYNMVGHHYSLLDAPGYDKTFIFAASAETLLYSNSTSGNLYRNFNYNDCGIGQTDSSYFFTAALAMNQPGLVKLRVQQLKNGKGSGFADIFLFKEAITFAADADAPELDREYTSENLGLFITRSSWDGEAPLFAGMIGGLSNAINRHAHLDNGSWVYYAGGHVWITDLGNESYNLVDGDFPTDSDWNSATGKVNLAGRYRYYRRSAEGHNTVIITSRQSLLPYGQSVGEKTTANLVELGENGELCYSDENGAFAMLDMKDIYAAPNGDEYAKSAYRGMLLTNGRKTLVIQDEIEFATAERIAWSAHISMSGSYYTSDYSVSEDGKTIYLKGADGVVCRMTIVTETDDERFKFDVRITDPVNGKTDGVYLLDATYPMDAHLTLGGPEQNARSNYRNIVIEPTTSLKSLKLSVVLETFDTMKEAEKTPVSYEYTPMAEWETYEEIEHKEDSVIVNGVVVQLREAPTDFDFTNIIIPNADSIQISIDMLSSKIYQIHDVYKMLSDAGWSISGLGGADSFTDYKKEAADRIVAYSDLYDAYVVKMNANIGVAASLVDALI